MYNIPTYMNIQQFKGLDSDIYIRFINIFLRVAAFCLRHVFHFSYTVLGNVNPALDWESHDYLAIV